ncbi:MltA-interacting MipA family protein [Brucella endophytica]|uniref:MltA-interacting MipA family protein n=1 Tax=Brucella endophytica TaxID=1963359 RepID=A0A916WJS7_9HYPH|nr:MipA/OmpV family protein [Brucella endophytica]GGB06677.1 MltA-interacting MipA family protein [Brucella endophytica]
MSSISKTNRLVSPRIFGLALGMGMAASASAADLSPPEAPAEPALDQERFNERFEPKRNWSLIIGGGAMYKPEYEGSEDFKVSPIPFVSFTYGEWLEINPRGVTVTALDQNGFSLKGNVGYESGRDEDDHDRLRGLGEIDLAATVGAEAAYELGPVELYAAIDQTIGGSESLIGTFGIGYSAPVTERLILGAKAEAVVANDKHMEAYFGVDAAQSAASGLREYKPKAGLKRVNISANATYMLTDNWLVRGQAELGILTGDAADSPIVQEKLQPSVSLGLGYKF